MAEKMMNNIINHDQQQQLTVEQQQPLKKAQITATHQPHVNVNDIQKFTFRNNNSIHNHQNNNIVGSRLGIDLNSTKSKRPVSTQFHETTTVAEEVIKPKQIDNDEMENKENESKCILFSFYILPNLIVFKGRHIYADIPNDYEDIDVKHEENKAQTK
jgi:hypothetical protein